MARCDVCGNDYQRSFTVKTAEGKSYTFDSFECAIHRLAPKCKHCGCMIIGHGVEAGDACFCCAHCAHESGVHGLVDNTAHAGR